MITCTGIFLQNSAGSMRLHGYLNNTRPDAGRIFRTGLRVWRRRARDSCRSSFDYRGRILCIFVKLGRLLQLGMLVHVAAWPAARALARPRNARRALEPARAARRLAASSSSRGASAARLPAVSPRLHLPAVSAAPHRSHGRRAPVAAATACAPAIPATALACHAPAPSRDVPASAERNRTAIEPQSYGPRSRPSLRARAGL